MSSYRLDASASWAILALLPTMSLLLFLAGCGGVESGAMSTKAVSERHSLPPQMAFEAEISQPDFNTEAYDTIVENRFIDAVSTPQSTFSIDVDTASYANVRRMINEGQTPPAGAVRIEELVNYFEYDYEEPGGDEPFSVSTTVANCPWTESHKLLRVGLRGKSIAFQDRAPCNLVFLLDVSGSMRNPNKLPLVKSALKLLLNELGEKDKVAIVVYAGSSGLVLDSTSVANAPTILNATENLKAGGSTNGGEGIHLAYKVAQDNFVEGGINRVILCTDGDFNVGTTSQSSLVSLIEEKAKSNVFLSVLGFGSGNLKDSTMELLADKGNGNYAYIDSMLEARKVLVEQVGATLVTIAKDVKIQVDFNPVHVQAYRLIGYENRLLTNQDFRDDTKDAGEIGAGHTVTAFYEIVPGGASMPDPLPRGSEFVQYSIPPEVDLSTMLTVNLRYKLPEANDSSELQVRVSANEISETGSADFQFATSVLAYGMLLRGSEYAGDANWDWLIDNATTNLGPDERGLRAEFVQLAKTAKRILN